MRREQEGESSRANARRGAGETLARSLSTSYQTCIENKWTLASPSVDQKRTRYSLNARLTHSAIAKDQYRVRTLATAPPRLCPPTHFSFNPPYSILELRRRTDSISSMVMSETVQGDAGVHEDSVRLASLAHPECKLSSSLTPVACRMTEEKLDAAKIKFLRDGRLITSDGKEPTKANNSPYAQ